MAFYLDEEEVWKCPKHPSKRRRSGICPICLRERLASLCPDCAKERPCACCPTSSSSSSSSLSRVSAGGDSSGVGSVGRVSNLIDSEPSFRRSRSVAVPFLRSRSRFVGNELEDGRPPHPSNRSKSSFWSVFKTPKIKKPEQTEPEVEEKEKKEKMEVQENEDLKRMMRSKSVGISLFSDFGGGGGGGGGDSRSKGRSWYFPSPIKVFRQSKASKIVQERSPLYRG